MESSIIDILKDILDEEISEETDFINSGALDSMGIMDLVTSLEDRFDIEISGRDILPDNFHSVKSIVELVNKYLNNQ